MTDRSGNPKQTVFKNDGGNYGWHRSRNVGDSVFDSGEGTTSGGGFGHFQYQTNFERPNSKWPIVDNGCTKRKSCSWCSLLQAKQRCSADKFCTGLPLTFLGTDLLGLSPDSHPTSHPQVSSLKAVTRLEISISITSVRAETGNHLLGL